MADGLIGSTAISASAMQAQAQRLRLLSENLANADTPGYRRKLVAFQAASGRDAPAGAVEAGRVTLDRSPVARVFDPGHPLADADGYHAGSNVNLVIEIADAREAQRSYEANLKMFEQARRMRRELLDIVKR